MNGNAREGQAMGYRYERGETRDVDKIFRAIELYGTVRIDQLGYLPFNQVLLLDGEMDTLCFVEKNMDLMIKLAVSIKKMDYL
jgi:hypothetical protein